MQISTFNEYQHQPWCRNVFIKKLITQICSVTSAVAVLSATLFFAPMAAAQSVTVVEYYSRPLDAYFMTGRSAEQALLDASPADFSRTGMEFTATAATAASVSQVRIG